VCNATISSGILLLYATTIPISIRDTKQQDKKEILLEFKECE
jgi:hypothetical protein